jgi:hypothetical protein
MSHNYYSEQCSRCKWGEWRGGCLNPASAEDLSDMDAAYKKGACRVFEAGAPQPDQTPRTLYVQMPKTLYDKLITERDDLRRRVEFLGDERDQLKRRIVALHDAIDNRSIPYVHEEESR